MRFKKLRIAVGISLVIFILLVGNIIVFGMSDDKSEDSSKLLTDLTSINSTINENKINTIEKIPEIKKTITQQSPRIVRRPVIIYRRRRTRAS